MEQFKPSSPLSLEGNTSENWKGWKQRFELYLKATEADRKDKVIPVAILLHCIGEDGLEAFKTFEFEREEDKKKIDVVLTKYDDYCSPRKNTLFERFKVWNRSQQEGKL